MIGTLVALPALTVAVAAAGPAYNLSGAANKTACANLNLVVIGIIDAIPQAELGSRCPEGLQDSIVRSPVVHEHRNQLVS